MRIRAAAATALLAACATPGTNHPPVPRPERIPSADELRCRDAAVPSLDQRELHGTWVVSLRPDNLDVPVMTGEIRLEAGPIEPALSAARARCKGCLVGTYFGPFAPLIERPPPTRDLFAIMRTDGTIVMSVGGASARPNQGDLALCGQYRGDVVVGIWWQQLPNGASGSFVMAR